MRIISVNLGEEREVQNGRNPVKTGIYKLPVEHAVHVSRLGLAGDVIIDTKHHGGLDQAVYVYCEADYDYWRRALNLPLAPGTFGENLTISGLESGPMVIGDRLVCGDVVLEVTGPRIPCYKLAQRMDDALFVERFRDAGRPGFNCRVLQEGLVQQGMPLRYEPFGGERITILEFYRHHYNPDNSEQNLRRYLRAPVAGKTREKFEQLLEEGKQD